MILLNSRSPKSKIIRLIGLLLNWVVLLIWNILLLLVLLYRLLHLLLHWLLHRLLLKLTLLLILLLRLLVVILRSHWVLSVVHLVFRNDVLLRLLILVNVCADELRVFWKLLGWHVHVDDRRVIWVHVGVVPSSKRVQVGWVWPHHALIASLSNLPQQIR